jgi:uncharacterized protein YceK
MRKLILNIIILLCLSSCATTKIARYASREMMVKICGTALADVEDIEYKAYEICQHDYELANCMDDQFLYSNGQTITGTCCDYFCPFFNPTPN